MRSLMAINLAMDEISRLLRGGGWCGLILVCSAVGSRSSHSNAFQTEGWINTTSVRLDVDGCSDAFWS